MVTKKCSECGNVLESERRDYCDGCGIRINQNDYDDQIRIGFLMKNSDYIKDDMVFHSFDCFQRNIDKIKLKGVQCLSIEYIASTMWNKIREIFAGKTNI